MKNIICLSGKQYSGKDTAAEMLLKEFKDFKRIGIADAIKIEFGRRNNLTYKEIELNKGIYRSGLIELGNEGRKINPDFWLDKIIESNSNVIVPDVRLIHEAEVFKKAGAILIRVTASAEIRNKRGIVTNKEDLTETELDNYGGFDYYLDNNGSLEELKENIMPLILFIKNKITPHLQNSL